MAYFTAFSCVTILEDLLCVRQTHMPLSADHFHPRCCVNAGHLCRVVKTYNIKISPLPSTFFISIVSLIKKNKKNNKK